VFGFIRADDLDRWASRIPAASEFPRRARPLVHTTARGPGQVDFPADKVVRLAGGDGKVLTEPVRARQFRTFDAKKFGATLQKLKDDGYIETLIDETMKSNSAWHFEIRVNKKALPKYESNTILNPVSWIE
jgi:hypothetical protein